MHIDLSKGKSPAPGGDGLAKGDGGTCGEMPQVVLRSDRSGEVTDVLAYLGWVTQQKLLKIAHLKC